MANDLTIYHGSALENRIMITGKASTARKAPSLQRSGPARSKMTATATVISFIWTICR